MCKFYFLPWEPKGLQQSLNKRFTDTFVQNNKSLMIQQKKSHWIKASVSQLSFGTPDAFIQGLQFPQKNKRKAVKKWLRYIQGALLLNPAALN